MPTLGFIAEVGAVPYPGYRLLRLRGRGAFASVFESETPTGGRMAIKFMSSASATSTSRELRSLQAIQTLEHPNLLRIRQVWSLPGTIAIAMDLADASLLDLFTLYVEEFDRMIEPEKLCLHFYQAAQALDFLNARVHRIDGKLVGLQHGDIKPNNILLIDNEARLADYGLATPTSSATVPCPRHGTAEYCPPEVFQGFLSERSDQFSLAVSYFVLRTGAFPYPQPPTAPGQLKNYVRPEPELSLLPEAERPILARALSPIPQNRFPCCIEFMAAILKTMGLKAKTDSAGKARFIPASEPSQSQVKAQMFR